MKQHYFLNPVSENILCRQACLPAFPSQIFRYWLGFPHPATPCVDLLKKDNPSSGHAVAEITIVVNGTGKPHYACSVALRHSAPGHLNPWAKGMLSAPPPPHPCPLPALPSDWGYVDNVHT